MDFSRTQERGMHGPPPTPPSRRSKDFDGPSTSRSLFRGPPKPHQSSEKRDTHSSGAPRYIPLGESVNRLKKRPRHSQPASGKNYQDIYTFGETPAPQNGPATTPDRTRRTGNPSSAPLTNVSRSRAKRKRVNTVDDSDSDEVVAVVDEFVRTSGNPSHEFESISLQDSNQRPNGTTLGRQQSGLFAGEVASSKDRLSEEEFDSLIYGQDGTTQLPRGRLFVRTNPVLQRNRPDTTAEQSQQATPCLYIHMDPRIHWTHNRSEEWHRKKEEEILVRGTRKENFGKATERMQTKRLQEALVNRATSARPARNDPGSYEFGRHVDFGDVPESKLPEMVKSNPEWLKATAWMRKCRQKSMERQREMERRQKAGLPWKGLLGASGIK